MTVHLFGAMSSPGSANVALKSTADDHRAEFGVDAANFLRNGFYVDDGFKSVGTVHKAVKLIKNTKVMCDKGGFNLHKFVSNSKEVLKEIPESDRAPGPRLTSPGMYARSSVVRRDRLFSVPNRSPGQTVYQVGHLIHHQFHLRSSGFCFTTPPTRQVHPTGAVSTGLKLG